MLVSVVIPALRWGEALDATVASLHAQEREPDLDVEVIVAVADTATVPHDASVEVVANPTGSIPEGLNLAIERSRGEIVARVDSRCRVQPDHVRRVVAALADPRLGCVGGAQLVLDRGLVGSTYAVAFNSALLGPTVYRYRRSSGPVDTAYLGAWRRQDLVELGGFDARLLRNQDNELADRVRASGRQVHYDAGLVTGYLNGRDLRATIAHHHEFGAWRAVQRGQGQRGLTGRHRAALGAAALVAGAGLVAASHPRTRRAAWSSGVVAYAAAGAWSARSASRLRAARPDLDVAPLHPAAPVLAPALAAVLDGAWLAGLLRGRPRPARPAPTATA